MRIQISEALFAVQIRDLLAEPWWSTIIRSVSGPGRSGAIAAVYASHLLRVPFIPFGHEIPDDLRPHLVIDTVQQTGKTLRKAQRQMRAEYALSVFETPYHFIFWYE